MRTEETSPASHEDAHIDERSVMVDVNHVTMTFNMANEQLNSLKEYFIKILRRELFFKEFIALDDVSFTVREGDVYGIVGTNGSGKSTMLKIVAGVLEPTKGTCTIRGRIAPLIELGAGFDLELTARENIYLNGALLGYSKSYIAKHFDEIVEFAELRDFLDLPMKNYSSGMVARIAFSIATIIVPDILIVDEALSVGDVFFQEKCERRIKSLIKDHGTTVLFVSHSVEQVERICQRAIWIEKGHKVMEGDVHEVCAAYRSMGYIDFTTANGIMERAHDSSFDIRDDATCKEMREVLERLGFDVQAQAALRDDAASIVSAFLDADDDAPLSRQTAAVLLHRFALSRRPSLADDEPVSLGSFFDASDIEEAREASSWCVKHELLSGIVSDDGKRLFDPRGALSRIGLAKMLTVLFRQVLVYPDDVSPTSPLAQSGDFDFSVDHGIMTGYASGMFGPRDAVTRAQAAVVLWRCAGKPDAAADAPTFPDVPEDSYFREQTAWMVQKGLMEPRAKGLFEPDEPIAADDFRNLLEGFCAAYRIDVPVCSTSEASAAALVLESNSTEPQERAARKKRPTVGRSVASVEESTPVSEDRVTRAQLLVVAARIARALGR